MQQALAPGSKKNLQTQLTLYAFFCRYFQVKPFPATAMQICCYAEFLARKFIAPGSIRNYVSGVKVAHAIRCLDTCQFEHVSVKLMFKAITRSLQHLPKQSLPLTPIMLVMMRLWLDLRRAEDATYWALVLLQWFLCGRKSNFVPESIAKFDPKKQLVHADVQIQDGILLITLKWSKTNQFGNRHHVVPVLAMPGSKICPVQAYMNMCRLVPGSGNDPLFRIPQGQGLVPLTYPVWERKLKELVAAIGHEPSAYSTHSCRRGGATYMSSVGVSKEYIMLVGDWKSDAVDQYIHMDMNAKVQALQKVRQQLLTDTCGQY